MTEKLENGIEHFGAAIAGTAQIAQATTTQRGLSSEIVTLDRQLLSLLYQKSGVVQTYVDQPVHDAFAKGVLVKSPDLQETDIEDLQDAMKKDGVFQTFKHAKIWARLFGGAGVIINIEGQDPTTPLDLDTINEDTKIEFYDADRWELSFSEINGSTTNQFENNKTEVPYNYYGNKIHKSRVLRLMGKRAPSLYRGSLAGWGLSVVERVIKSLNSYDKHMRVSFELMDEAKIDVYKIKGFNSAVSSKPGVDRITQTVQTMNLLKNYVNAVVMDKEDEYEQKTAAMAGLGDIVKEIRIQLAADFKMPLNKLFGISASGFSSGEDDLENYNADVQANVQYDSIAGLEMLYQIYSKKLFGFVPENLQVIFPPLRTLKETEESAIKTDKLNRTATAMQNGLMSQEKAQEELNAENVFLNKLKPDEITPLEDIDAMMTELPVDEAPRSARAFRAQTSRGN